MAPGFVTAVPVLRALAVAGRPVCASGSVSCLPALSISAASRCTGRGFSTGLAGGTVRIRRDVSRAPDRPRPWVGAESRFIAPGRPSPPSEPPRRTIADLR
jgi:hypothetical protein